MRFEFSTATQVIFGPGTIKEIGTLAAKMGCRAFVLTGRDAKRWASHLEQLGDHKIELSQFKIQTEPTIELALAAVDQARKDACDFVIGIGGGSVLDTGKVAAALLTNSGTLMDYLEVIGNSQPLKHRSAPYIAIPTTAGTGTEVTRNAVLDSPRHRVKVSMRSPFMLPNLALIDPELTYSMPPHITANTGLDAFTQLLEAYVSRRANPLTDGICREGLRRAARSLVKAYKNGSDAVAREDMSVASFFGGLALANAGLGAVHGFAGPLGGMYPAAHGAVCASLLPHTMEANVKALQLRASEPSILARFDEVGQIVTGSPKALAADGIAWVKSLCQELKVLPLADYGIKEEDFSSIVAKSQKASSMKGNPVNLTSDELLGILKRAV